MDGESEKVKQLPATLRMVAWEVIRSCNLNCVHCRAAAACGPYAGELDTAACFRLLDDIAAFSKPVIILTGGEPLLRPDIWEIAAYGDRLGLRMVMATNGTLVTEEIAGKMAAAGIRRVSVSLDGPDAMSHDGFRRVPGAFAGALAGIGAMKKAGMEFQINTTITRDNLDRLREIHDLALNLGAAAHHIFLLVPTGRARDMADREISAGQYEETLEWFYEKSLTCPIQLKATCAPHYYRIFHQHRAADRRERQHRQPTAADRETGAREGMPAHDAAAGDPGSTEGRDVPTKSVLAAPRALLSGHGHSEELSRRPAAAGTAVEAVVTTETGPGTVASHPLHTMTRGCLGGVSFCFISHRGQIQPCGYLELDCGRIGNQDFREIWEGSPIFRDLRDLNRYQGKCGRCEFIRVCGGCRARAYERTGDYLAEEPYCLYEPKG